MYLRRHEQTVLNHSILSTNLRVILYIFLLFRADSLCTRCTIIGLDQKTGEKVDKNQVMDFSLFLSPLNTFLSNSETTLFYINKTTAIPASWCSKIKFILNRFQDPISALTKRSGQRFKFGVLASLEESELIQKDSRNLSVNMEIKIVRKWTKTIWKTTY